MARHICIALILLSCLTPATAGLAESDAGAAVYPVGVETSAPAATPTVVSEQPLPPESAFPAATALESPLGPSEPRQRIWVDGEYLLWWTKGMSSPALLTTSPANTPQADAGVLGRPGTTVLFGNDALFDNDRSGGRVRLGVWLDNQQDYAVEGEYFFLGDGSLRFYQQSDGDPILARPFFDVLTGQQNAEIAAYPGVLAGKVTINASTALQSAGVDLRGTLWVEEVTSPAAGLEQSQRLSLLAGYRHLRLNEGLSVHEDLASLNQFNPGSFAIDDSFDTSNTFDGAEIGVLFRREIERWSLESRCKLGLGNNHEVVDIAGSTVTQQPNGLMTPYSGGILAQRTNSGLFSRDQLSFVPEVGINLGYRLTEHLQATIGYSFIYWTHVVRPGDQINSRLNPNLFPPERVPFTGPLSPAFAFQQNDYWMQGLSFGFDYRW